MVKKNHLATEALVKENNLVIKNHLAIDHLLGTRNLSEIKNHSEKILVRVMPLSVIVSLERPEVLLRKKLLKKGYSEKHRTKNLASVVLIQIKKHLVKKNHLVTENQVTEKQVIESQLLNANLLQKRLLKSQQRLEHLEPLTQNQSHQNVKCAFKIITDFA